MKEISVLANLAFLLAKSPGKTLHCMKIVVFPFLAITCKLSSYLAYFSVTCVAKEQIIDDTHVLLMKV